MIDPTNRKILCPDVIRLRRRGGWRQKVLDEVGKISPVVAKGLMVHFNKRADVNAGKEALNALTDSERSAIWRGAFPGIAEVVELAWTHLAAQTIARRDGGSSGNGEPFFWKLDTQESDHFKFEWLRKLLIVTGPFPELDFPGVIRHLALIGGGRVEESDADYRETSGHSYDTDAPAYAASVLLSHQRDSAMAKEVVEILEGQLIGTLPYGYIRAICTSWLCADRPDLWRKINTYLAESALLPDSLVPCSASGLAANQGLGLICCKPSGTTASSGCSWSTTGRVRLFWQNGIGRAPGVMMSSHGLTVGCG